MKLSVASVFAISCSLVMETVSFSTSAKASGYCSFSERVNPSVYSCQKLLAFRCKETICTLARKSHERWMEASSVAGAHAIAKLNVNERTKRAMLAEAIENRIFEIMDELEKARSTNGNDCSRELQNKVTELSRQAKALEAQYDDVVNGRPSHLLDLEATWIES